VFQLFVLIVLSLMLIRSCLSYKKKHKTDVISHFPFYCVLFIYSFKTMKFLGFQICHLNWKWKYHTSKFWLDVWSTNDDDSDMKKVVVRLWPPRLPQNHHHNKTSSGFSFADVMIMQWYEKLGCGDDDDVVVVNFNGENGYFVGIKVGHGNEIGSCVGRKKLPILIL